jgi:hypothetical protein
MNIVMKFDKLMELLPEMFSIVERAANESCCLCRDECLSCDAKDLLKDIKEITEK